MPRIEPLSAPYDEAVRKTFDAIMPPGVEPLTLFRTIAVSERAWRKFRAGALIDPGPLSLREREIVINRTCALTRCAYEWGVHVSLLASAAKLSSEELTALATNGAKASCWPAPEAALIAIADTLHLRATLTDDEWGAVRSHYNEAQVLEIFLLCGFYRTVAYLANGLALPLEPGSAPLPT